MDPVSAARDMADRVGEHKAQRHAARAQIRANFDQKVAMIRERMGNCQAQHEKEIIRAHQAQVECLLVEVEKRNSRQAVICKKLAEIRNECLNLSKQLRAVYAGREELARSSTSQTLLDASTRKARPAAA